MRPLACIGNYRSSRYIHLDSATYRAKAGMGNFVLKMEIPGLNLSLERSSFVDF